MLGSVRFAAFAAVLVASTAPIHVLAQTFTSCNPTLQSCPANPALGSVHTTDYTKGEDQSLFSILAPSTLTYDADRGAIFSIANLNEGPTVASNKYIFFGKVEVVLQAAPGAGIVTSVVLLSDDLDEIDFEWIGNDPDRVQSNYFSKGDTTTYDRGGFHASPGSTSGFHTYTIEWTRDAITWSVDNAPVRVLTAAEARGGLTYPQTPMQVKFGTWVAGRPGNSEGTIAWAGGLADFSQAPFLAYFKSITVTDYANGVQGATQYSHGDFSGTWQSIIVGTNGAVAPDGERNVLVGLTENRQTTTTAAAASSHHETTIAETSAATTATTAKDTTTKDSDATTGTDSAASTATDSTATGASTSTDSTTTGASTTTGMRTITRSSSLVPTSSQTSVNSPNPTIQPSAGPRTLVGSSLAVAFAMAMLARLF